MSVTLVGAEGFFTRQGAIIGEYNRVADWYGSGLDAGFVSIWSQFASGDQAAVENLPSAVESFRNSNTSYLNTLVSDGQQAILLQVNRDTSVVPYTLQQALTVLIAQMKDASETIQRPTLGSTVTPWASNLGDATLVASTTNQYGDPLDMTIAETLTITCTSASPSYGETLSVVGEAVEPSNSDDWPGGSGASTSFTILNQAASGGIVTDGGFETWGGTGNNTPTYWTIVDGDAGVTVFRGTGGVRGSYTADLTSDGSQPTQLAQNVTLAVNTVYAVCVYAKISANDATGQFVIQLTDGDGNVLQDDAGTNLSSTVAMNGGAGEVGTSFAIFTAFFSTPRQLPTTVQVRYGYSTAATAAKTTSLDLAGVVAATQAYTGGPFLACFAGASATAINDYWSAALTNSLTSQSFARGMDRLYGVRSLGVYFPSAGSPTVPDSLVTH